jgi:hypothetical protein
VLQFKQSDTEAILTLTLTETASISDPNFLFVFTHVLTKEKVKFVKATSQDESSYTTRYNQFTIDPSVVFLDAPIGEWHYKVYEQVSSTNTDEDLTGDILEYGKMILDRETEFEFTSYNEATTYKAYNG